MRSAELIAIRGIHPVITDGQAPGGTDVVESTVQKERVRRAGVAVEGEADIGGTHIMGDGSVQEERRDDSPGVVIKADNTVVSRWVECAAEGADGGTEIVDRKSVV